MVTTIRHTFSSGFSIGAIIGLTTWLYYHNLIPFIMAIFIVKIFIASFYVALTIIALAFTFIKAYRRKSVISPFADGIIYGTVAIFDLLHIGIQFLQGNIQLSIDSIYLKNL